MHKDDIIMMYNNGKTCKEIGEIYNIYPGPVSSFLRKQGVVIRKKGFKKGNNTWNKGKIAPCPELGGIEYTNNLIESDSYKTLGEGTIRKHVKRFLIYKNGHKCEICHNNTWNNQPISLICDHIDGNWQNNEINNFRLVCPNCDAQLPTFKSKNRGNGRQYDKEYYKRKWSGRSRKAS